MKNIALIILITILNSQLGFSIYSYEKGDTLYNWTQSGLKIRAIPEFNSKVIETIPFGKSLIAQEEKEEYHFNEIEVKDSYKIREAKRKNVVFHGRWLKIKFNDTVGFVFDAYLSKFKNPLPNSNDFELKRFLSKIGIAKTISHLPEYGLGTEKITYDNGGYLKNIVRGSTGEFKLIMPEFSFEESFLLIYILNSYIVDFEKRKPNSVYFSLECGFYQITVEEKVAIITGGFGC